MGDFKPVRSRVVDTDASGLAKRLGKAFRSARVFETRREAEAARAQLVTDLNRGSYMTSPGITLEAWVEESWLPTMRSRVKPSTWDSYSRNMRLHIIPKLGRLKLQQVTPTGLNALYADLLDSGKRSGVGGLSPKTVRYVHSIIHKALADAIDAGLIATNSADKAKPPRNGANAAPEIQTWTAEELSLFLKSVDGHRLEAAWHLAAMTGMRRGEVLGLRWKDVDFRGARVFVRQTFVSVAYEVMASTPKTHQARVIDLDAGTVRQLRTHSQGQQKERSEWAEGYQEQDLVFCKEDGSSVHPHTFSQAFGRLVAKTDLPRIRLHDLRHTHASIALAAGVPVKVISERLGHETPAFTLRQYAHVIPGMQSEAAKLVASLVEPPVDK